jgi:hypothetical protein
MKLPTLSPAVDPGAYNSTLPSDTLAIYTSGSGGTIPTPATGCYFAGTQCRGFIQSCKYCCGDGGSYSQSCGSCIGWYDAPPCVGGPF